MKKMTFILSFIVVCLAFSGCKTSSDINELAVSGLSNNQKASDSVEKNFALEKCKGPCAAMISDWSTSECKSLSYTSDWGALIRYQGAKTIEVCVPKDSSVEVRFITGSTSGGTAQLPENQCIEVPGVVGLKVKAKGNPRDKTVCICDRTG